MKAIYGKKGTEWTVGRLMTLVLVVVLLALVIWGVASGNLLPLFEKVGGMADSVLISLGLKEAGEGDDCFVKEDSAIYVNAQGEIVKGKLSVCLDYCKVDVLIGSYSINSDRLLKRYSQGSLVEEEYNIDGDRIEQRLESIKVYKAFIESEKHFDFSKDAKEGNPNFYIIMPEGKKEGLKVVDLGILDSTTNKNKLLVTTVNFTPYAFDYPREIMYRYMTENGKSTWILIGYVFPSSDFDDLIAKQEEKIKIKNFLVSQCKY